MKKILLWILAIGLVAAVIGYSMYNKGHRDIQSETPVYDGRPDELFSQLAEDRDVFSEEYTDKTVVLHGMVTGVADSSFTLENTIICHPEKGYAIAQFERGMEYSIKGRVVGFEEDLIEGYIIRVDHVRKLGE